MDLPMTHANKVDEIIDSLMDVEYRWIQVSTKGIIGPDTYSHRYHIVDRNEFDTPIPHSICDTDLTGKSIMTSTRHSSLFNYRNQDNCPLCLKMYNRNPERYVSCTND